jgi:nucleotide-binding universal stress UspA family protein
MLQQHAATQRVAETITPKEIALSKILVATDFSPASDRALEVAISIARRFNSTIYLTHVVALDAYPMVAPELAEASLGKLREEAKEKMTALVGAGRFYGVARNTILEEGTLWPTVEKLIEQRKIDLLVVGTHGRGGVKKLVLGSGAEEIFRHVSIPVITVGPHVTKEAPFETEFRHILFATDFGPAVEKEAAYAFSLAQQHRARLLLLNVVPYVGEFSEEAVSQTRKQVKKQLAELIPAGVELTCKPEYSMVIGEPAEEILRAEREIKADLIIMGAKSRTGLVGPLPRTNVYKVVCGAQCPVLTIKS